MGATRQGIETFALGISQNSRRGGPRKEARRQIGQTRKRLLQRVKGLNYLDIANYGNYGTGTQV